MKDLNIDRKTAIAAGISVVFLLLMIFAGIKIVSVDQPDTSEPKKLRVQASAKTYTRDIPLEFANQPDPTPEELLQEEPSPTPAFNVDVFGDPAPTETLLAEASPTPEEELSDQISPTPTDLPVATPSVPVPEPTDDQLLASGSNPTPTPVQQLPDAGNFGNLLILLAVSSVIVLVSFIL